jgi:hypothetical protein
VSISNRVLLILIVMVSSGISSAQSGKTTITTNEKKWRDEWRKREGEFQQTLKTLNLRSEPALPPGECIGASIYQLTVDGGTGGFVQVVAPVGRAIITDIKGFARESNPGSTWWQCPFQAGKQCGEIVAGNNPTAAIHPGGTAFMPFSIQDLDDGKTLIRAQVVGWAAGYTRDIRIEIDYRVN